VSNGPSLSGRGVTVNRRKTVKQYKESKSEQKLRKQCVALVEHWMKDQLRPEGRKGIYIDDIAVLAFEIQEMAMKRDEKIKKLKEALANRLSAKPGARLMASDYGIIMTGKFPD
jgi:hypothetical protein